MNMSLRTCATLLASLCLMVLVGCAGPAPNYAPSIDNVEMLKKSGQRYHIQIGEPIQSDIEATLLTPALRKYVTQDLKRGNTRFVEPDS